MTAPRYYTAPATDRIKEFLIGLAAVLFLVCVTAGFTYWLTVTRIEDKTATITRLANERRDQILVMQAKADAIDSAQNAEIQRLHAQAAADSTAFAKRLNAASSDTGFLTLLAQLRASKDTTQTFALPFVRDQLNACSLTVDDCKRNLESTRAELTVSTARVDSLRADRDSVRSQRNEAQAAFRNIARQLAADSVKKRNASRLHDLGIRAQDIGICGATHTVRSWLSK